MYEGFLQLQGWKESARMTFYSKYEGPRQLYNSAQYHLYENDLFILIHTV